MPTGKLHSMSDIRMAFKVFDADANGKLSGEELKKILGRENENHLDQAT